VPYIEGVNESYSYLALYSWIPYHVLISPMSSFQTLSSEKESLICPTIFEREGLEHVVQQHNSLGKLSRLPLLMQESCQEYFAWAFEK
jgi:hypothetical protein